MKRVVVFTELLIKRQLKNPVFLALLILLPVITLVVVNIPALSKSETPRVVLFAEDEDYLSIEVCDSLVKGSFLVEFERVDSMQTLVDNIYDDKADCGYIFSGGLSHKINNGKYDGAITVITNSSKYISSITKEVVFAEIFKVYARDLGVSYINQSKLMDSAKADVVKRFLEGYNNYLNGDVTFHLQVMDLKEYLEKQKNGVKTSSGNTGGANSGGVNAGGETSDAVISSGGNSESLGVYNASQGDKSGNMGTDAFNESGSSYSGSPISFPFRGILALIIYLAGLFGGVSYLMDKDAGFFVTMPKSYRIGGAMLYCVIPTFFVTISSMIALGIAGLMVFPLDVLWWIVYMAAVTLFSYALTMIIRNTNGMITAILLLAILCVVATPVFIDISGVVPVARVVRWILLPGYMM